MDNDSQILSTEQVKQIAKTEGSHKLDLNHLTMNQLRYLGQVMSQSGMFPDAKAGPTALVKILAGQEIGMPPFQAMTNIHIIQGKATMSANLMAAKVKGHPKYDYKLKLSPTEATVTMYEVVEASGAKEELGDFTFTIEDAKRAGLVKAGSGWEKYPQNMLFARAISSAVRMYAPDVFNGNTVYSPDELGGNIDEGGNYVEAEMVNDRPNRQAETKPETPTDAEPDSTVTNAPTDAEKVAELMGGGSVEPKTAVTSEPIDAVSGGELNNLKLPELIEIVKTEFSNRNFDTVEMRVAFINETIGKKSPANKADYIDIITALRGRDDG